MTELSFLIELLLNHDLKKETKDAVASRIKEVEAKLIPQPFIPRALDQAVTGPRQAASTLALMARHGDTAAVPIIQAPAVESPPLNQVEMQARERSMELLKKKHKTLEVK